jgi:hypothetical protein
MRTIPMLFLLAILSGVANAQQNPPPNQDKRSGNIAERGDHVMGFSHEATTQQFRLFKDGGEIAVTAKDPNDKPSIEQIRAHLGHIAKMFSSGNFKAPMLIHDTSPPGTATMARLKDQIRYEFSETDRGARIRLVTGQSGDNGRGPRLPAFSNRRSSDGRCSYDIRRTREEAITQGGLSALSICVRPAGRQS